MRRNIFDLISNKEIDVEREYIRIHKLFEKDIFYYEYGAYTLYKHIDENYFRNWKNRGRCISLSDMFTSLNIRDKEGLRENTVENLLLYIEVIVNLIEISNLKEQRITRSTYKWEIYSLLEENINNLLEDLNYEIKKVSKDQLVIIERDMILSAVVENFPHISEKIIEYRRFILKGKLEDKKEILNSLAHEIEGMKKEFKSTTYANLMDDVQFMLNNLNIRHNNIEGQYKKQYVIDLSKDDLEKLYDQTFDMILSVFVIHKYLDIKKNIDILKKEIK